MYKILMIVTLISMANLAIAAETPIVIPMQAKLVQEQTLENGLKVIVKKDHRAPVVTSQVWYKIGSSYEYDGLTGISHALEHMMFKGTKRYGPGKFSEIISANGGDDNAFTGRDYTAYFQNLANDRLNIAFELEADRMRNLTLPAEEFAKELEVVKEERRLRTEDNPNALALEHFYSAAYILSPYRNPVIGWMTDLEHMTVEQLRDWYRQWYAPNNATLVVVGDVNPSEVFVLAKQFFGSLKAEVINPPMIRNEPTQLGIKRITIKAKAKEPYLIMGYKTPKIDPNDASWEPYALEILASILDGGSSARFGRELIRGSEIATDIDAEYSAFSRLPEMFTFDAAPATGHSIVDLEQAIRAQLIRVKEELVTKAELDKIRNQVVASKVFEQDSIFYQAMQIGMLETIGLDWRLMDNYVEKLNTVTAEQVQAVAKKYLIDDNLTVAVLDPQAMGTTSVPTMTSGASDVIR